jgi:hypothetical protein
MVAIFPPAERLAIRVEQPPVVAPLPSARRNADNNSSLSIPCYTLGNMPTSSPQFVSCLPSSICLSESPGPVESMR